MTTAPEFLASLRSYGFRVEARCDKVYVTPRDQLSEEDVEQVKAMKPELMHLLTIERMIRCPGVCRASVDPDAVEDLAALCDQFPCPFREEFRRKPR